MSKVAALAFGLRDNSRIKLKMRGEPVSREILIEAAIADRIGAILAVLGGQKQAPASLVDMLYDIKPKEQQKRRKHERLYVSGEEFKRARDKILKGGK